MSFVDTGSGPANAAIDLSMTVDGLTAKTNTLGVSAGTFARLMTKAFTDAAAGGKQFDEVLKSLALRLSNLALKQAFKPLAKDISKGLSDLLNTMFGIDTGGKASGGVTPFAVDTTAGIVTFLPGHIPASGAAVTAGFLFDVPVRFDTDYLEVDLSAFAAGAIPKIPLVEIKP